MGMVGFEWVMTGLCKDFEGPHHVVGFVLQDVAVVEVVTGVTGEADDDASDDAGGALDDIFPAELVGGGLLGRGGEAHLLMHEQLEGVEGAAVEDLEADEVEVHGVDVFGLG